MLALQQPVLEVHPCQYLAGREARTEFTIVAALEPGEYEVLMDQGHRKFGPLLFHPRCVGCAECRPIRVPVPGFRPDQSQRRALRRNGDLRVRLAPPRLDAQRMDLYRRYHLAQSSRKGWPDPQADEGTYTLSFLQNPLPAIEVSAWEGTALRAVLLADVTPRTLSAVYHYHDPDHAARGLGTFVILQAMDLARRLGRAWLYLGFHVEGCRSMSYKSRYRPCEILTAAGTWREVR